MLQTVIALLIVAAAVGFAVRGLVRTFRSKKGCSCGCTGCPCSGPHGKCKHKP